MAIDAVCTLLVYMLSGRTSLLVLSCLFTAVSELNWDVLDVVTVEVFPTTLRLQKLIFHIVHVLSVKRATDLKKCMARFTFGQTTLSAVEFTFSA
jgi:hypothetical protein